MLSAMSIKPRFAGNSLKSILYNRSAKRFEEALFSNPDSTMRNLALLLSTRTEPPKGFIRMYQIIKPALSLLGAFTLLATLLYDPIEIALFVSGEPTAESSLFILGVAVLAMAFVEAIFLIVDHKSPSRGRAATATASVLFPIAGMSLILGIAVMGPLGAMVPFFAVMLLCMGAISQIHCFTRLNALDAYSFFASSAMSLVGAVLLLYIAFFVLSTPLSGFILIAFVMSVTGLLTLADAFDFTPLAKISDRSASDKGDESVLAGSRHAVESHDGDMNEAPQHLSDIVILALPLLIVSLFCTFVLGQSQQDRLFGIFDTHLESLLIVLIIFFAIVLVIHHYWKHNMSINPFLASLSIPLMLPILATLFEHLVPNLWIASMLMLTQILYLLFSWTCVLLIGRMVSAGNSLTPGFFVLFLMFYVAFMALPPFENVAITSRVITLASLGLLLCLLFYFAHKANRVIVTDETAESEMSVALQRKCDEAAEAYGLSPRESELLPMLAIGLSASVIGNRIILSDHTVKTHRYRIYQKLGINSHEELVEKLDLVGPASRV